MPNKSLPPQDIAPINPINVASTDNITPAVQGTSYASAWSPISPPPNGAAIGVYGLSGTSDGVQGNSESGIGVHGLASGTSAGVVGYNDAPTANPGPGMWAESVNGEGLHAVSHTNWAAVNAQNSAPTTNPGPGVWAESANGEGLHAVSHNANFAGVYATNTNGGYGVYGARSGTGSCAAVYGVNNSDANAGVAGFNEAPAANPGPGMWAESANGEGLHAVSHNANFAGVYGYNAGPQTAAAPGVYGESKNGQGVSGVSHTDWAAVNGYNDSSAAGNTGPGMWAESVNGEGLHALSHNGTGIHAVGASLAAQLDGAVQVNGTLTVSVDIILSGADFAEDFTIAAIENVEPGTVMVLGENGTLRPSEMSYDRKVAGVISGGGDYRPGLILDRQHSADRRLPLAMVGKVWCKADAQYGAIAVGDLLTSSPTLGHAMKAVDPTKAFGAVIGKALASLQSGRGLVPILVALQ
jgi:hypothetical protein